MINTDHVATNSFHFQLEGQGIRAANYALSTSDPSHHQAARAAKIIAALPKQRRCGRSEEAPPLLRVPQEDPWGCPEADDVRCHIN